MIRLTRKPKLVEAAYVVAYDGASHAVRRVRAAQVIEDHPDVPRAVVPTACGGMAGLMLGWREWRRDNPLVSRHPCHACAWTLAIEGDALQDELEALRPGGYELAALARLVDEPLMTVRICEALLAGADLTEDGGARRRAVMLLAHATAHAPALITPLACQQLTCRHDRPAVKDSAFECYAEATAACHRCSAHEGDYAGDWGGMCAPECTVLAPCAVTAAFANHLGVEVGGNRGVR